MVQQSSPINYVAALSVVFFTSMVVSYYSYMRDPNRGTSSVKSSFVQELNPLPDILQDLFGREAEMDTIMGHLTGNRVNVVTMYGAPGLGKTEIAVHLGHRLGIPAQYIRVEDFSDVYSLKETLGINIPPFNGSLSVWARGITQECLLILDNVDGVYWINQSKLEFQKFVNTLNQHSSSLLKILITSQREIKVDHKYRPILLLPLLMTDCVQLFEDLVGDDIFNVSKSDMQAVCDLVGNVPLAIKVLSGVQKFSSSNVDSLIKASYDKSHLLMYLVVKANSDSQDRLFTSFNLSFNFVRKECQIFSLLLHKFQGSFVLNDTLSLITSDVASDIVGSSHYFDHKSCLDELSVKSFLEKRFITGEEIYSFHALVKGFLNMSRDQYNMTTSIHALWENYFTWQYYVYNDLQSWKVLDIYNSDVKIFTDILEQRDSQSYALALFIARIKSGRQIMYYWSTPYDVMFSLHYEQLISLVTEFLLSECKRLDWTYATIDINDVLTAYGTLFHQSNIFYWEDLANCEQKAEYLHKMAKGNHAVMFARSIFHNSVVGRKCMENKNQHAICKNRWEYYLLDLAVVSTWDNMCKLFNTSIITLFLAKGLDYYAVLDDTNAIGYFDLMVKCGQHSNVRVLHDSVAHIALYSIFQRLNNTEKAEAASTEIRRLHSQCTVMSCYAPIYGYLVIPFLRTIGESEALTKELCNEWMASSNFTLCTDPYSLLYKQQNRHVALVHSSCNDH